jgi:glycosyltransferase involved in cell wall biosynthesis
MISVIIPTLNRSKLTERAYQSAINQSHKDLEVIVVDNGSSDSCLSEMSYVGIETLHCRTLGAGAARKAGLAASVGEFVLFLDSDDSLGPNAIRDLLLEVDEAADGVFGAMRNSNSTGLNVMHGDSVFQSPLASNTLLRRDVFDKFGVFSDDNYSWPAWLMNAQANGLNLTSTENLVATRHIHGENLSMTEDSMSFYFKEIRKKLGRQI